ncbi:putative nucleotidyltransferase component of viral defense system [Micromonospora sp. HB375]|uniref:nucleotidyl transferase AbiEii/AbiGii toxin family protein n=2 Tax=Micromonosporaceae TaxID=28056 RepID=UPI001FD804AE|nr:MULTISPECIES: nucleotidyl transferase AbiEii/AbiGii toxin family protein [unclassified Micromonospora]MBP1785770.1 putative nucleotidyltransferase component of viral defense system [Micromonospora sp. HB375]MDH6470190.1 putative nucleotidyltransferase component of viral defense system [Micromonospora sp. H404/HB375]
MSPAPDPFQHEVARIALAVAGRHGFALAGGQALIAHGIGARPTEDVDLFTDLDGGVTAAAELVHATLLDAGFQVETIAEPTELDDAFYGFEHDMTEFEVRRDDRTVRLQLVRFARSASPIVLDVGPVLHLDDVIGTKVAAMVTRAQPRDYIDVAAALRRYSRNDLVDLARRADPALTDEEFQDALQRLDRLPDTVFALYRLTPAEIHDLRHAFSEWPR